MVFKGIIFDFNGVLWWDTQLQGEAWSRYASLLRAYPMTEAEITSHVIGRDNRYILHYLTGKHFIGQELEDHTDRKETIYRNLCLEQGDDFQLSPGAAGLLDWLQAHRIRRAIATSAGRENVLFYYIHMGLWRWFDLENIVYDDDRMATKPAPDPYLLAAQRIGLPPEQCVVVEDSLHGIQSACQAGIGCIIALGMAETHGNLRQVEGVQYVVENLGQVQVQELFQNRSVN
jgi:beta-phosphoglucomutase-like phosphatase (HAD superfamily)